MPRIIAAAAAALAATLALAPHGPALAQATQSPQDQPATDAGTDTTGTTGEAGFAQRNVSFVSVDGTPLGTAEIAPLPHGVMITLDLQGLPPGSWLGFHIHENGECDTGSAFESAGDHFTISDTQHGLMHESGPHSGDMPNQYVGSDGILRSQVFNTFVQLGGENAAELTGRSLVLHAGPDDYQSQPSGNSGDRIACAVIE